MRSRVDGRVGLSCSQGVPEWRLWYLEAVQHEISKPSDRLYRYRSIVATIDSGEHIHVSCCFIFLSS